MWEREAEEEKAVGMNVKEAQRREPAGFEDGGRGRSQRGQAATRSQKRQERDSPVELGKVVCPGHRAIPAPGSCVGLLTD